MAETDFSTFKDKDNIGKYLEKYLAKNGIALKNTDGTKFGLANGKLQKWDFDCKAPTLADFEAIDIVVPKSTTLKVDVVGGLDNTGVYQTGSLVIYKGKMYYFENSKWNLI